MPCAPCIGTEQTNKSTSVEISTDYDEQIDLSQILKDGIRIDTKSTPVKWSTNIVVSPPMLGGAHMDNKRRRRHARRFGSCRLVDWSYKYEMDGILVYADEDKYAW